MRTWKRRWWQLLRTSRLMKTEAGLAVPLPARQRAAEDGGQQAAARAGDEEPRRAAAAAKPMRATRRLKEARVLPSRMRSSLPHERELGTYC
jgi:hypothetical protein